MTSQANRLRSLRAAILSFTEDGQRLVLSLVAITSHGCMTSRANRLLSFEGSYPRFTEDGQRLVTPPLDSDNKSWLYDLSGQQIAELQGSYPSFTEDGQRLVTYSTSDNRSWLYDLSGQQIAEFEGSYPSFSEDGQRLVPPLIAITSPGCMTSQANRLRSLRAATLASLRMANDW